MPPCSKLCRNACQRRCRQSQCEADFKAAKEQHAQVAPKYTSQADCEADFGAENDESPLSNAKRRLGLYAADDGLHDGQHDERPDGAASQPLYRSKDDPKSFRTADNKKVGNTIGRTQVARSSTRAPSISRQQSHAAGLALGPVPSGRSPAN